MKHLLPCLFLLTPVVATGQSTPPASSSRRPSADASTPPEVATRVLPSGSQLSLEGALGFRSLYYLLNSSAWPALPRDSVALRSGSAVANLADPLQIIVIFNAWHLPAALGSDDIRLADLRKHVLRSSVEFTSDWPNYATPGFIVLIQKRDHEWALVARLSGQYLIEDRSGIGVCAIPAP